MSSHSTQPTGDAPDPGPTIQQRPDRRDARARSETMDVALLKQGGIYTITGESGQTYQVDIVEASCSCSDYEARQPENGCKHLRRVELELDQGTVPRPDGKLPASAIETAINEVDQKALPSDTDYQHAKAAVIDEIHEREEEIARLQAEIDALEFVVDTLELIADEDAEFSLDTVRDAR